LLNSNNELQDTYNPCIIKILDGINRLIPEPALYEQLAEECAELAQACLKKSRKLREENYTPKTDEEIKASIIEEFTDVLLVADVLGIRVDYDIYMSKGNRWISRNV
jgi:hypothetical protein